jgi:DNA-binding transcriptional LysR family regulator
LDLLEDMMFDWNDLRYFLAVARSGSTLAASKKLKVSQATVSRRIGVLEEAVGTALFTRKPSGYDLTPRGAALLPEAEGVEAAVLAFTSRIEAETRRLTGTVRLTTVEAAANEWVIPALPSFRALHPDVQVSIITANEYLDLARDEADLAIRFGQKPTQDSLIVRHLLDLEESLYASKAMVARLGMPAAYADLQRFPIVLMSEDRMGIANAWLDKMAPGAAVAHRADTFSGIIASIKAGLGISVLPCLMGDDDPALVRLFPPIAELTTPGWMVTTDMARRQPHVRALIDFIVEHTQTNLALRLKARTLAQAA